MRLLRTGRSAVLALAAALSAAGAAAVLPLAAGPAAAATAAPAALAGGGWTKAPAPAGNYVAYWGGNSAPVSCVAGTSFCLAITFSTTLVGEYDAVGQTRHGRPMPTCPSVR
jgi:hypothetical protein